MPNHPADFIWIDAHGTGRNVFAIFRQDFTLPAAAKSATLHLFADTRYRLRVNGHILSTGPTRFLPTHPQFDTIDLIPYLNKGANVITVEVNHFGDVSFESKPSIGGFIAWGEVRVGTKKIDLSTPGKWVVHTPVAWDPMSPPYSFAQGPTEICDTRLLPDSLFTGKPETRFWTTPTKIANQAAWGTLSPRSITMPTFTTLQPDRIVSRGELLTDEQIIGGRVNHATHAPGQRTRCAYFTWLYSPRQQSVTLGAFWGPHYLNGQPVQDVNNDTLGNRKDLHVHLNAGWNFLFGEPEMLQTPWVIQIGLPAAAGLIASTQPVHTCDEVIAIADGIGEEQLRALRPTIPTTHQELPDMPGGFKPVKRTAPFDHPARLMGWIRASNHKPKYPHTTTDLFLTAGKDEVIVFDMGREYIGHYKLELTAPPGVILDIANDELIDSRGLVKIYRSHFMCNCVDRFIARGGKQTIEGFRRRGGRYIQVTFRNVKQDATLHSIGIVDALIPIKVDGQFESSDAVFDWAYTAGLRTQLYSLDDSWVDPWRERGLYIGDALVEHHATWAASNDPSIVKRSLLMWSQGQYPDGQIPDVVPAWKNTPLHDYSLIFIILLHDYVSQSADLKFAKELWPTVVRIFNSAAWKTEKSGLWNSDHLHMFIDWGVTKDHRKGENGVLNAFRVAALERAAILGKQIGKTADAKRYSTQAAAARKAFANLWNSDKSEFAATRVNGELSPLPSMHTNCLALLYELYATPKQKAGVLDNLKHALADERYQTGTHLEIYFYYYLLHALMEHGEVEWAENLIRRAYGVFKDTGGMTVWETFDERGQGTGSQCHGWAAAANSIFARYTLGVRPVAFKPSHVVIAPRSATLSRARGVVAHPAGPIEVSWIRDARRLILSVRAPKSLKLDVRPVAPFDQLQLTLTRANS
jgi:alpha-L-rhamnosidase